MQAVILCGGRGERLIPLTACRPAALLKITGETVLNYALNSLKKAGFEKVTFALGYLEGMIMSEYESGEYNGIKINFISTEDIGTAGALAMAYDNDDMLVIEANSLFNFDLKKVYAFHTINKSFCTIVTKKMSDLSEHVAFSCDKENKILSISQNPAKDNLKAINGFTGVYILSKQAFSEYRFNSGDDFIQNILPAIIGNNKLYAYLETGYFTKITNAEGLIKAQHDMLKGNTGLSIKAADAQDSIYTDTLRSFNGVAIIPPVYIGKNVTIDKGSVIEPYSVIDDNAVIGSRVRVSGSYIGENAVVSSRSELTHSVVCNNALINKSVYCGEYSVIGEKAVIGDGSRIDDNIKIWAGKEVMPNSKISRNIVFGSGKPMRFDDDGEYNFGSTMNTPVEFSKMGMAIGTAFDKGDVIVLGYSDKNTAKFLAESLTSGLASTGINVFNIGKCTDQQTAYGATLFSAKAGCYISANYGEKIRIRDKGGLPLKRSVERRIEDAFNSNSFRTLDCYRYGKIYEFNGTKALYEIYLDKMLPERFSGILAEVRCSSKETACLADNLFHERNDIDGEKIIFHVSADGGSCSAYTEKTGYVFHERLLLLAMKGLYEKGLPVSVPYSFPMAAEQVAGSENGALFRYYNSSDDDSDDKARLIAQRTDNLFMRDGLMLACAVCRYLSENKITFEDAIKKIPNFSLIQRFVSYKGNTVDLMNNFAAEKAGSSEGIVYAKDQTRVIIRPLKSGNSLMIFAESFKSEQASSVCDEIQEKLKRYEDMRKQ